MLSVRSVAAPPNEPDASARTVPVASLPSRMAIRGKVSPSSCCQSASTATRIAPDRKSAKAGGTSSARSPSPVTVSRWPFSPVGRQRELPGEAGIAVGGERHRTVEDAVVEAGLRRRGGSRDRCRGPSGQEGCRRRASSSVASIIRRASPVVRLTRAVSVPVPPSMRFASMLASMPPARVVAKAPVTESAAGWPISPSPSSRRATENSPRRERQERPVAAALARRQHRLAAHRDTLGAQGVEGDRPAEQTRRPRCRRRARQSRRTGPWRRQ